MNTTTDKRFFKTCPMCKAQWHSLEDFLGDEDLSFNGYQADLGILDEGLFFFTHNTHNCGSTMALSVGTFGSLYTGERYPKRRMFSEDCPRMCTDPNNLDRCDTRCECAYAREISEEIKQRTTRSQEFHAAL